MKVRILKLKFRFLALAVLFIPFKAFGVIPAEQRDSASNAAVKIVQQIDAIAGHKIGVKNQSKNAEFQNAEIVMWITD